MNLIDRLELMAYNADSYRCMLTNGKVDEKHAAADREAIETVMAMQEALQKITAIENKEYGPDWEEIEEARNIANEALRRAGA